MKVLGHRHILETLPRLKAQTFLFSGPEGVGRRTVARWFAAGLNCAQGFPPCGACPSCRLEPHPDYLEIGPQSETKTGRKARLPQIRLEQIAPREGQEEPSLLEWMSTYPRFRVKVAVIDGAHWLGEAAANALLKLLEEPPGFARIVLVAPSRELVLPTLASRSLEVGFAPLPEAELRTLSTDPEALAFAQGSVGRLRWALEHPQDLARLTSRVEGVLEAMGPRGGPAQTLEALQLLGELEEALPYLARRLGQALSPEQPAYRQALEALAQAQDALAAYVSEDLVVTWLALRLARL
ncbi:DNA polymerase III subunit gamma/tau [Meiothermus rufus]|uniref:DNA polymerase III subunit gamma/tau n=1 Tax=Meiothermus rufus TaxID=604332 RepID=UPI0003F64928|nr:DNA polymerase III subunit gamma/tau [Meiothermus rufus]